jgi:hypothetical protein
MNKHIGLIIALTAFSAATLIAQSPTPTASPEPSASAAKHKHSKKQEASPAATAAAAESPVAASPSPSKQKRSRKKEAAAAMAESPAAASPAPAKHPWFSLKPVSPTPATSPVAATSAVSSSTTAKATNRVEPTGTPAAGGGPGMVWVNTETHVYHQQGSRWYGRTKHGKYMSEQDATKEGDRPDKEESKAKKQ